MGVEYESTERLEGAAGAYFTIPSSIIFGKDIGEKRVTAFSYFSVRRGIDGIVSFSTNMVVNWAGRKPNRRVGGINDKMFDAIFALSNEGFICVDGDYSGSKVANARYNSSRVSGDAKSGYATIYVDELYDIFGCDISGDGFVNVDILLLVFAYLRMRIYRRPNKLRVEELNVDGENDIAHDIDARRRRNPEAYNGYYCDIADDLGLSPRVTSKAIDILVDIGLIYSEPLPRTMVGDRWLTSHSLFCNAYKRERNVLLDGGKPYYTREIENKKCLLGVKGRR